MATRSPSLAAQLEAALLRAVLAEQELANVKAMLAETSARAQVNSNSNSNSNSPASRKFKDRPDYAALSRKYCAEKQVGSVAFADLKAWAGL